MISSIEGRATHHAQNRRARSPPKRVEVLRIADGVADVAIDHVLPAENRGRARVDGQPQPFRWLVRGALYRDAREVRYRGGAVDLARGAAGVRERLIRLEEMAIAVKEQ